MPLAGTRVPIVVALFGLHDLYRVLYQVLGPVQHLGRTHAKPERDRKVIQFGRQPAPLGGLEGPVKGSG